MKSVSVSPRSAMKKELVYLEELAQIGNRNCGPLASVLMVFGQDGFYRFPELDR